MDPRWRGALRIAFLLLAIFSSGSTSSSENDRDFVFCGDWIHGNGPLKLTYDFSKGCSKMLISANESTLSVVGQIMGKNSYTGVIPLVGPVKDFCLHWEPLLDNLWLEVGGQNHTVSRPAGLQGSCCTDLSRTGSDVPGTYGISKGNIKGDIVSGETLTDYTFFGETINCKETFCDEASQGSMQMNMIEETVMRSQSVGSVYLPCAQSYVLKMEDDFQGYNVTLPAPPGVSPASVPSIYLPSDLKPVNNKTDRVVCTLFKNVSLFQSSSARDQRYILEDVVGISVENEVIKDLIDPIRIGFKHPVIPRTHSRRCVSWDARNDPLDVSWKKEGCWTDVRRSDHTECLCNHLTYFAILVQLEGHPVPYLLPLSVITSLGCAASMIGCVALIIFLCRKKRPQEQSRPVHLGLALSLFLLYLLFFLTGTLANLGGEGLCLWVGAGLHYALLSSLTWMGIEVFNTFWLVYRVFSPSPLAWVWNLVGFGAPLVPVVVLASIGNIYGVREVVPAEDVNNPYLMCWMKSTPEAWLAHYFTNVTLVAVLMVSGLVMLVLVYRQIRSRDEWRQNRVAFLSIWGLSCLFGVFWFPTSLSFGLFSDIALFLFCVVNSFQGFFLMLRFYLLDWMRRQAGGSALGSSSTGSTRQHMLQAQEMG